MSWRDRPYAGDDDMPQMRLSMPRPTTAVMWLIVANVIGLILDTVSQHIATGFWHETFGLSWYGLSRGYIWQPLTYMFTHAGLWHLVFNMFGLYIFGIEFERVFGRDRFLTFYAICGLVGGLAYLVLSVFSPGYRAVPLVGASGAVYGLLIAAIIFFPHIQVVVVFFPMPIRVFGLLLLGFLFFSVITPGQMQNLGGEVCHMAGAATGVATLYFWRMLPRIRLGGRRRARGAGAWQRRIEAEAAEQAEVDRILAKVSHSGIHSLTRRERRTLEQATKHQREREQEAGRIDRV
jgi:membrane associated rhomboid family serine protease